MSLKTIRGRNRHCGPAAIAALTGLTTDEAAKRVRMATGKGTVRGMSNSDMLLTLFGECHQGICDGIHVANEPLSEEHLEMESAIVSLMPASGKGTGHFIAVDRGTAADTGYMFDTTPTRPEGIPEGWVVDWIAPFDITRYVVEEAAIASFGF